MTCDVDKMDIVVQLLTGDMAAVYSTMKMPLGRIGFDACTPQEIAATLVDAALVLADEIIKRCSSA